MPPDHQTQSARRRIRRRVMGTALALAWACVVGAALHLRPDAPDALLDDGLAWWAAVVALVGVGLAAGARMTAPAEPARRPDVSADVPVQPVAAGAWGRRIALGVGLLALVALTLVNLAAMRGTDQPAAAALSPLAQFALLALSVVGVIVGVGSGVNSRRQPGAAARTGRRLGVVVGVLLVALALRLTYLDTSIRALVDEVHWINGMQVLWWNENAPLLTAGSTYLPSTLVYSFWETIAVAVFGTTLFGLRVTSAIVGMVGVAALYALVAALAGRRAGLAAALILATFPPHVHFSRIAMAHVGDALFGTLALAWAARALRQPGVGAWAVAGVMLALTQYFYEGGRLLFPPLFAVWLVTLALAALVRVVLGSLWHGRRRAALRVPVRGLAAALALFVVFSLPVYLIVAARGSSPTNRLDDAGVSSGYWRDIFADGVTAQEANDVWGRLTFPFQVFVHQPELAVYYGGAQAMILEQAAPLFLVGAAAALWLPLLSRRHRGLWLLLVWCAATALGNALIRDSAQYPRWVVVFPAVAALMGIGAQVGIDGAFGVWSAAGRAPRRRTAAGLATVALAVVVGAVGLAHTLYYFGPHLALYNHQLRGAKPYPDGSDAVLRAVDLPPGTQVYLISEPQHDVNVARTLWAYLRPNEGELPLETITPDDVTPAWLRLLSRDRPYAFFVQVGDVVSVNRLAAVFALQPPQFTTYDVPVNKALVLYYAPPDPEEGAG